MKTAVKSPESADYRRGLGIFLTETPLTAAPKHFFRPLFPRNPHFPALRSGPTAVAGTSREKANTRQSVSSILVEPPQQFPPALPSRMARGSFPRSTPPIHRLRFLKACAESAFTRSAWAGTSTPVRCARHAVCPPRRSPWRQAAVAAPSCFDTARWFSSRWNRWRKPRSSKASAP